ncbi:MAG: methionyl-tRNA synthetase [Candidatus Diapherotrites archaeon]|nr:methionyl-tRNA synthetase [Candidatus Diapherotrites archaeon]MDN5367256.1 methionyl-tRNA synthetase [Candidatus Diapherotrites archaeon]
MVSYDEFAKLDIRVALVKKVEDIPGSKKLYKLIVDLGDEERTLVAGLKGIYSPEELEGRKIVVLANLEPKKLMGVTSQGMLLAADDGENVALLLPDRDVKVGARVR